MNDLPSVLRGGAAVILLMSSGLSQGSGCPPQGLDLSFAGGTLGDSWTLRLLGTPHAPGYLGGSLSEGPVPSPVGSLCLGAWPPALLVPVVLDGGGEFLLSGLLPPVSAAAGTEIFLQAAVADLVQPGGVAVSNGASARFRPPRLFFGEYIPGSIGGPFSGFPAAGRVVWLDGLTESFSAISSLGFGVLDLAYVPSLDILAILGTVGPTVMGAGPNDRLGAVDLRNGAVGLNQPLAGWSSGSPSQLLLNHAETELIILYEGSTLFGLPGGYRTWSPTTGSITSEFSFTNGNPRFMALVPEADHVALFGMDDVAIVDLATSTLVRSYGFGTTHGPIVDHVFDGSILYVLLQGDAVAMSPPAVARIDLSPGAPPFTLATIPTPYAWRVRLGPGSGGQALMVLDTEGTVVELAPSTLSVINTIPVPARTRNIEPSAGETEWLLVQHGTTAPPAAPAVLHSLDPVTHVVTPVLTMPQTVVYDLVTLRSDTLTQAYVLAGSSFSTGLDRVIPVTTDPSVASGPSLTTPLAFLQPSHTQ